MADDPNPNPTGAPATGDPKNTPRDPKPDGLGDAGKKALDAERDARRKAEKDAKDLAEKLQAIEDKDKSEVEKLTSQVQTLTAERDAATARADRIEVAVLKSLDEDRSKRITSAAKRLTGTTREELEADADELIPLLGGFEPDPKPTPGRKPTEQLKAGTGDPDVPVEETDLSKIGERIFAR